MRTVRVTRKGADRVASGHPWIFSSDVDDRGGAEPGESVLVADPRGRMLGTAHYSSSSQITIRMLSSRAEEIGPVFFRSRLEQALNYRRTVAAGCDAYRLVHAEADRLPALIVDIYGAYASIQTLNQGMDRAREQIVSALREVLPLQGGVFRNDVAVRKHEDLPLSTEVAFGTCPDAIATRLNGLEWSVDLLRGQKTGIYLDQRENYAAAVRYARGRALDCFTSTGGFALHLASRCESVEAVDSSATALSAARANAAGNAIDRVEFRQADVLDLLPQYVHAGRKFQTIVLDPPAFTKSRSSREGAARGYKEINQRALRLLDRDGVLVTCSCSHHFSEAMLLETLAAAALDANRTLRVLERRTQAQDHPILLTVPETHYLKCLIVQAMD